MDDIDVENEIASYSMKHSSAWKTQPSVAIPGTEWKSEQEEFGREQMDVMYKTPESQATVSQDR